jgi:hypothetical protein
LEYSIEEGVREEGNRGRGAEQSWVERDWDAALAIESEWKRNLMDENLLPVRHQIR